MRGGAGEAWTSSLVSGYGWTHDRSHVAAQLPPAAGRAPAARAGARRPLDLACTPNIDNDGDVAFTVQRRSSCSCGAPRATVQIMRVFGQWQISDDLPADPLHLHETCNELNLQHELRQGRLADDTLVVIGEHLVTPGSRRRRLLVRCRSS